MCQQQIIKTYKGGSITAHGLGSALQLERTNSIHSNRCVLASTGKRRHPGVRRASAKLRIVTAFNQFALQLNGVSQSRYDEHMGSVTRHYDVIKVILNSAIFRRFLLPDRARTTGHLSIADFGCGTGELITYLLRELYLDFIANGGHVSITLVDPAKNMLEVAQRKLVGMKMQCEDERLLEVRSVQKFIDRLTRADMNARPDIAICSYLAPWLVNGKTREESYRKIGRLLADTGILVSLEEDPLVVTPTASLPTDFEATLLECASPITPAALRLLLEDVGFREVMDSYTVMQIDAFHSLHGSVFVKEPKK